jgi:hypothetical protein
MLHAPSTSNCSAFLPTLRYFLTRPQLLTRIHPLPVGRDISQSRVVLLFLHRKPWPCNGILSAMPQGVYRGGVCLWSALALC